MLLGHDPAHPDHTQAQRQTGVKGVQTPSDAQGLSRFLLGEHCPWLWGSEQVAWRMNRADRGPSLGHKMQVNPYNSD